MPARILGGLAAEEFSDRERAEAELLEWAQDGGEAAVRELLEKVRETDDPEVRARCVTVLRELAAVAWLQEDGAQGYIGISLDRRVAPLDGGAGRDFGVIVAAVMPGTAADKAGLDAGDIIVSLNGSGWTEADANDRLMDEVKRLKPASKVVLEVKRGERLLELEFRLGRRAAVLDGGGGFMQFPDGPADPAALERAEREAFFRRWLRQNRPAG